MQTPPSGQRQSEGGAEDECPRKPAAPLADPGRGGAGRGGARLKGAATARTEGGAEQREAGEFGTTEKKRQ